VVSLTAHCPEMAEGVESPIQDALKPLAGYEHRRDPISRHGLAVLAQRVRSNCISSPFTQKVHFTSPLSVLVAPSHGSKALQFCPECVQIMLAKCHQSASALPDQVTIWR
jgi:hypothetical protein